jgi:hypothetical protein
MIILRLISLPCPGAERKSALHGPNLTHAVRSHALRPAEFEADAKAKIEEVKALLEEREEEFYSYQNAAPSDDDDDYDDEDEDDGAATPKKPSPKVDTIDYADDEDDDDDVEAKDEM